MIKIKYDNDIDAKYVRIKEGKISYTEPKQDWLMFDYAENGDVLGIEILNTSEHQVGISVIDDEFISCSVMKSETLKNGNDKSTKLEISKISPQLLRNLEIATA